MSSLSVPKSSLASVVIVVYVLSALAKVSTSSFNVSNILAFVLSSVPNAFISVSNCLAAAVIGVVRAEESDVLKVSSIVASPVAKSAAPCTILCVDADSCSLIKSSMVENPWANAAVD